MPALPSTLYCSASCRKRVSVGKRNALKHQAPAERVDPLVVLRRDDWHCRICGITTPQHLRGTYDPCAPEVDHIVPLSKGGHHTYANTQCVCRRCNSIKSDSIAA